MGRPINFPRLIQKQNAFVATFSPRVQHTLASIGHGVLFPNTSSHEPVVNDSQSSVESPAESMKQLLTDFGLSESDLAQLDGLEIDLNFFFKVCP